MNLIVRDSSLKILFVLAYIYIFGVLLNYENAWMHKEVAVMTQTILAGYDSWSGRFIQLFDWQLFEGEYNGVPNSRGRIFSNLFQTINILLRNWLFQFVPPHPSLSLTWLVALGLCPHFLYKLVRNLTGDRNAGIISAFIYIITPGALIPIIMLFHPGKVFSNFFYIYCLYLGSCLVKNRSGNFRLRFSLLVLTVTAALFFDEYSLFLFVLIPLFYPGLFWQRSHRAFAIISYLLIPVLYYAALMFFLPKIYTLTGHPGFDFFRRITVDRNFPAVDLWAITVNFFLLLHDNLLAGFTAYLKDPSLSVRVTEFFSVTNRLLNGDNIRLGLSVLNDKYTAPFQVFHNGVAAALTAVFLWSLYKRSPSEHEVRGYFLKSGAALIIFSIFFSVLHITNNILSGCGYYGAGFSALFAVTAGTGLKLIIAKIKWKDLLVYVFLVSLMINSFHNVRMLNYAWLALHFREPYWELDMWTNQYHRWEVYEKHFLEGRRGLWNKLNVPESNFKITWEAWKNRKNPAFFDSTVSPAPPELRAFLLAEVPYIP